MPRAWVVASVGLALASSVWADAEDGDHVGSCSNLPTRQPLQEILLQHFGDYQAQQNMLEDGVRVDAYKRAIDSKTTDFENAVCLDVGAGMGILSFLAAQAGAQKVIAIEPSPAARVLQDLAGAPENHRLGNRIHVVHGFVEDLPSNATADIIMSEPFSYLLFSEFPILAAYLRARDRFLKPGGLMFPDSATLYVAPFNNEPIFKFLVERASFWRNTSFYGINLQPAFRGAAAAEIGKPVVMTINPATLTAAAQPISFDFKTLSPMALENVSVPFSFDMTRGGDVNGLAVWFDIGFPGGSTLSTAPTAQPTHWQQVALFLKYPLVAMPGQRVVGELHLQATGTSLVKVHMCIVEPDEEGRSLLRYLPTTLNGVPVLRKKGLNSYSVDNMQLQSSASGMGYRRSKDNSDKDVNRIAMWGSTVEGHDEGDGWIMVKVGPACQESELMDIHRSQTRLQ